MEAGSGGGSRPTWGGPWPAQQAPPGLPAPPTAPSLDFTNTAQTSPELQWLQEQYRQRLGQDPTQRAMDMATSQTRDITSGLQNELSGNLARRGMIGSGVETQQREKLAEQAQRAAAGQAGQITLGRQGQLDQLVAAGLPIMGAADQLTMQKQQLGLQQYQMQQQAYLAQLNQAMQQQQQMAQLYATYMGMFQ